jgi:signal peptidase
MTLILIVGTVFIVLYIVGIEPYVVETGSMRPVIQQGSISFINKHVEYSSIQEGDIIAFKTSTGDRVTHRVIHITEEGFETKGDANDASDGISTTPKNYIGKNVISIPKVGFFVKLIQTTKGKIILITVIIVILLAGFLMDDKSKQDSKEKSKGKRFK